MSLRIRADRSLFLLFYWDSHYFSQPCGPRSSGGFAPQKEQRCDASPYLFWGTNPLGISRSYAKIYDLQGTRRWQRMKLKIQTKTIFAVVQFLSLTLMVAAWICSRTWSATDSHVRSQLQMLGGPEAIHVYENHRDHKIHQVRMWGFSLGGLIFLVSSFGCIACSSPRRMPGKNY